MSTLKVVALVLIVAGVTGLVMGSVSYTKTTHAARVGPFNFAVDEKKTINIPLWAGVAAIVAGAAMLFVPKRV
ncbi:MAG TPA: hypothetical protein VFN10_06000 [Thermoanaerobaculia bacterium]|nr:hypothetical protein [Thermoanaerobaculia bacterium]